jgi:aminocarboxymuconate-semialdehyde decarboxylase
MCYKKSNIIIDVHHHVFPDIFKERHKNDTTLAGFNIPFFSVEDDIKNMNDSSITFAITSISAEESYYDMPIDESIKYFDECNKYQISLVNKYPNRYGAFLNLPLQDINCSIKKFNEINEEYKNKFDGIYMPAGFKNIFLGDNYFINLYEELNKGDGTVIFVHPSLEKEIEGILGTIPLPFIEYMIQTTRTISTLLVNNIFIRFPKIKWIFPHMGGTFPYISHRLDMYLKKINLGSVQEIMEKNKNVYFDTACAFPNVQWNTFIKEEQLLTGSDMPYQNIQTENGLMSKLNIDIIKENDKITFENALSLFPRIKTKLCLK